MCSKKIEDIFQKNNYEYFHKKITKSTMQDARNFLKNSTNNCIFFSDEQLEGKGQKGNNWSSPKGNIYCSISFNNFLNIKKHFLYSALIAISIKMSLEKFNADNIYFKWPNDIFYKKKKFAGIISEIINVTQNQAKIIIGFGINFISAPNLENYKATYVKSFCKIKTKEEFLLVFTEILFYNLNKMQLGKNNQFLKSFSKSLMFIDQEVVIALPNTKNINGIFRGINDDGSLRLESKDKLENIYSGSILI